MFSKSHNYGKFLIDRAARTSRATAFAYWLQAKTFEQAARKRDDTQAANAQAQMRAEREQQLLEWDATEGGNI